MTEKVDHEGVDAVAVIVNLAAIVRLHEGDRDAGINALLDDAARAYAAVAGLIAASRELQDAMDDPPGGKFDPAPAKRFLAADARHRAALSRLEPHP